MANKSHLAKLGIKQRGEDKVTKIPVAVKSSTPRLPKPNWIRVKAPLTSEVQELKKRLREQKLHTVCEEASCPNLTECFGNGTATFMIMGDVCTRRCSFCDVAHGRPLPLDKQEPEHLANTIKNLGLNYVVITSVDRDDLHDGGAQHFIECIQQVRDKCTGIKIEILVPDFRGRLDRALEIMIKNPADVFNHNLETVPRLYPHVRPGAEYQHSLDLLLHHKKHLPTVLTKSGLMLGLGEQIDEVLDVMKDLRANNVDMLTLGQYLQPSAHHLPVQRYLPPSEFDELYKAGKEMGFDHIASGPLVRSSYHADVQAKHALRYS